METKKYAILYVDDEESNLHVFYNTFRRKYAIFTALSASEGLAILERESIDLIISDQRMPEMDGVEFLKRAMINNATANRILITAYSDFNAIKNAINIAKVFQYIEKPWNERNLQEIIDNALEVYDLRRKNEKLIQELREKNVVLEHVTKKLREHDVLKTHFLQIISHEIRTPLNGLVGATQLFKENLPHESSKKYADLFSMLEISIERLEKFLLLAERITILKAGKYKIERKTIDLESFIADIIASLQDKICKKNITIITNINTNKLRADTELLKISVSEILDNAIKYTQNKGVITITSTTTATGISIVVQDNGQGFSEFALNHVYEMFSTFDNLNTDSVGLDLALVKLIMDVHQGVISIRNNSTQGAWVELFFKNI